jgi:hypothetical protein
MSPRARSHPWSCCTSAPSSARTGYRGGTGRTPTGGLPHHRDVKYRRFGLLVELDGRDGHDGVDRFRDMRRDNLHALLNELTLRFGWFDVSGRPCPVAYQVYLALQRGGYSDRFCAALAVVRCPRSSWP